MAAPWEKYGGSTPKALPWEKYRHDFSIADRGPEERPELAAALGDAVGRRNSYSGSFLPFTRDAQGNVSFDANAGIFGAFKRAFELPGQVSRGEVDPNSDEGIARAFEMGAAFSPVNPGIRAGSRAIPGVSQATRPLAPPSAEVLKDAASAGYDQAREMGVEYSAASVGALANTLKTQLERDGIFPELAPKTFSILERLANPPEGSVGTLAGLEAARRAFGNAAMDFANPTEQLAAQRLIQGLDEFVQAANPATVVAGPARQAASTLAAARGNYAASQRSARLQGVEDAADIRAAAANSGQNLDNTIRQRVASLLLDPKKRAGYSPEEITALEQVATGTATRNTLRIVGNLLGGGGGLGAVVSGGIGGTAFGTYSGRPLAGVLVGAGIPAAGMGIKKMANALTRGALNSTDEMTRMRSPLYSEWQRNTPASVITPEGRAAIMRMLLLSNAGVNQPAQ